MLTICSFEANSYQLWQVELLYKTFMLNQSGNFMGVAHNDGNDIQAHCFPVYWTKNNYKFFNQDNYSPYNKIAGIKEFLLDVPGPPNETIMLIDPDCIILKDINILLKPRTLLTNYYSYMHINDTIKNHIDGISDVEDFPAVGIPYIMRRIDLLTIIDRWFELCVKIRERSKDWIVEMWAFSIAIQESEMKVITEDYVGFSNSNSNPPHIIHYCNEIQNLDDKDIWSKRYFVRGGYPDPKEAKTHCGRIMLETLHLLMK